jgi:D-inositol-3-phosphate glycosyltransferase
LKIDMVSEHASPLAALGGPDAGGQNVHVGGLATALARRGHEVVIFTRRDNADLPDSVVFAPGVAVEHVPAGPPRWVPKDRLLPYMDDFAATLERRWMDRRPDVVHAHFWMSGLAALAAGRGHDFPIVETFHALGSVKRRYQQDADTSPPGRIRLESRVAREVTGLIATCTAEVEELGAYGVPPDRVFVVPGGVAVDEFRPDGAVSTGTFRAITFGRLLPRKGVGTIIEALAHVPGVELVVVGGPERASFDRDAEARRLIALTRRLDVADRVVFLGQVPHEAMPRLIRSADVAVSVPWYEPFGIAPLEAMACGVPVIASAVGGHLDTVLDGVTGLHVPPRDPKALARSLRELRADGELRRSLGGAAAEHTRGRHAWSRIAAETEAVYERLVSAPDGSLAVADGAGP